MLDAEIDVHMGDEAEQATGNHCNCTGPTTLDTGSERVVLDYFPRSGRSRAFRACPCRWASYRPCRSEGFSAALTP